MSKKPFVRVIDWQCENITDRRYNIDEWRNVRCACGARGAEKKLFDVFYQHSQSSVADGNIYLTLTLRRIGSFGSPPHLASSDILLVRALCRIEWRLIWSIVCEQLYQVGISYTVPLFYHNQNTSSFSDDVSISDVRSSLRLVSRCLRPVLMSSLKVLVFIAAVL